MKSVETRCLEKTDTCAGGEGQAGLGNVRKEGNRNLGDKVLRKEVKIMEVGMKSVEDRCLEETDTCTGGHRQVGLGKAGKKR